MIDFTKDAGAVGDNSLTTAKATPEDEGEYSLRPKTLAEYIGQEKAKRNLEVFIEGAKRRGEPLDHVILHGPPGLGKTTLAAIIANEMGVQMRKTSGPAIEKPRDLAALLTNLEENDILFIDEIHRMNRYVEEILYPAMEDKHIDIIIGKPLRDRFGIDLKLELYEPKDLKLIIERSAGILGVPIEPEGAIELAKRSRGTPRIANRILRRVRDFAEVYGDGVITKEIADHALERLEIDKEGLDAIDRRLLTAIIEQYGGGPVGLDTLAATVNEESVTIEDVYEPYLMQQGYLTRTPRGRCVTRKAYDHLKLEFNGQTALNL